MILSTRQRDVTVVVISRPIYCLEKRVEHEKIRQNHDEKRGGGTGRRWKASILTRPETMLTMVYTSFSLGENGILVSPPTEKARTVKAILHLLLSPSATLLQRVLHVKVCDDTATMTTKVNKMYVIKNSKVTKEKKWN